MKLRLSIAYLLLGGILPAVSAQNSSNGFDTAADLAGLVTSGTVSIDATRSQAGTGSMKVEPGATVSIPLFSANRGGTVTLYYYDDLTVPSDPTVRRKGPLFGLAHSNGQQLAVGGMYAPYLAADGLNHSASFYDAAVVGGWFGKISYLSGFARKAGWQKWTFDMDPVAGLTIYRDDVLASSFKWVDQPLPAFNSIVILGDAIDDVTQTVWIDEVSVVDKGPMQVNPDGTIIDPGPVADLTDIEFDSAADLEGAIVSGAFIDTEFKLDGAGSLRVEPGGTVIIKLSDIEQAGTVTLYHYDDMTVPADPKVHRTGMRWGLRKENQTVLAIGGMYASYLVGNTNYISTYYDTSSGAATWFKVQHLSQAKRTKGWHKWVFDLDPDNGLSLYIDNTLITAFKWPDAFIKEFNQLVFYGDVNDANGQTYWIDNVNVELKGATQVGDDYDPIAGPPDPEYTGPPIGLVNGLENVHPRLCFTEEGLSAIRSYYWNADNRLKPYLNSVAGTASTWAYNTNYLTNATEGQRVGLWYLPSLALDYIASGKQNPNFRDRAIFIMGKLLEQNNWETGGETDTGMSAGNILGGVALAFDWLYDELDPLFREQVREALWLHARRMYHAGHLTGSYWSSDPQNNHRWHRNYGFILATIAAYTGDPSQDWLLSKAMEELDLVMTYLPEDGSNHEGPGYFIFGLPHIYTVAQAADLAWGTNYLDHPYFRNAGLYWSALMSPTINGHIGYGDYGGGLGYYAAPLFAIAGRHGQGNVLAMLNEALSRTSSPFQYAWMGLIGYVGEPATTIDTLPNAMHFPDIEFAVMRDKFANSGVAASFKSGATGGYALNQFRDDNGFKYINVAHDDPDANSFTIFRSGDYIVPSDKYSYSKKSANHNTILVNGKGQENPGRAEAGQWTQPSTAKASMTTLAYFTNWKDAGDVVLAEGEAADYYRTGTLTRFRRSFIWNEGKYILVLDDIRGSSTNDITWLVQSPTLTQLDAASGTYDLVRGLIKTKMQIIANADHTASIGDSPADDRKIIIGHDQLRLFFDDVTQLKVAALVAPWSGSPAVAMAATDDDHATITVTGDGYVDTWTWTAAVDDVSASSLVLSSDSGQSFDSAPDEWRTFFSNGLSYRSGGGDWFVNEVYGYLYPDGYPWIYHAAHGWLYCADSSAFGKFFWSPSMGWLWTHDSYFPWMYKYADSSWIN